MKNKLFKSKFFYLSNHKRTALYTLLLVIVACFFVPRMLFLFSNKQDALVIKKENVSMEHIEYSEKKYVSKKSYSKKKKKYKGLDHKGFLNDLSVSDWIELGLSEKQAQTLHSIASMGIMNEEELKQIKYLPEELFLLIKDSVLYKDKVDQNKDNELKQNKVKISKLAVALNTSDYEQLIEVPGIGYSTAKAIVKYRELIGGYYSVFQLLEVYTIRPENFEKMRPYLYADTLEIIKINLNSTNIEELRKHPYLNWNEANSILKRREQKGGKFEKLEEILSSDLIDEEIYNKLRPYLSLK